MLTHWPRMFFVFLIAAQIVRAQTTSGAVITPSDDRKEPKTLSKAAGAIAVRPVANGLDDETNYKPETSYVPDFLKPTPSVELPKTTVIDQTVDGVAVRGLMIQMAKGQPRATLLLLPEWWGLNESIRREAEWWAHQGYRVLTVDLYEGKTAKTRGEAARLMGQLKPEAVLPELKAALTLAAKPADAPSTGTQAAKPADAKSTQTLKLGVLGFGIGATYAQRLAAEDPRPAALVLFYGEPVKDGELLKKITAPILAIFAGRDAWVTPDKITAFKKALTGARLPAETYSFMTLPGFMFNEGDSTDRGYIETAHQKALGFFSRELED